MGFISNIAEQLALKNLTYDGNFIKKLLNATSSKALTEAYGNDPKALLSLLFKLRAHVIPVTDEFPQSGNKSHVERTIESLKSKLNAKGGLFIDLGAAAGEVSDDLLKAFPDNEFHLFEPIDESYNKCIKRFSANQNVTVHKKAVGNTNTQTVIHKSKSSQSSSLLNFSDNIETEFFKERIEVMDDEVIDVVKLDDYLKTEKPIWLIKLDVQGYEIPALEGAEQLLKQTSFVLCEMMNHDSYVNAPQYYDIDAFMRSKGFKLLDLVTGLRRDGMLLEFDSLYYNPALVK